MRVAFLIVLVGSFLLMSAFAYSQKNDVYVDKNGVMRWGKTKQEVYGFGVNYTVPFAHAYRAAKHLSVSHEEAIRNDVYHFARLGFDAYRVHVWDTEVSDTLGNLLNNEHLKLFDYMLQKMKERGMKFILTPIAYWGNGYPEPDEKTPGFARKYGKGDCLTNEEAIKAQETYLYQFLNHVNSYTGIAYKDDPDIVAFEISNEPHHGGPPEKVTQFINRLVKSMRKTGCKKPILYNISHSIHLVDAYFNAAIQGGTFQWYPTGLGARHELRGNFLPNVERYTIPFADNRKFKAGAKIVYEFDAADIGRSYIYPAMARSFREAGIQWATHFSYDPTYMAYANTEYNTHYMNLVHAPQKALSLKLASEVFHNVPMYKNFGRYPANTSFDAFNVSYEKDLAEMVTANKFIYTNDTDSQPPAPESLEEIAGFANSRVVQYEGSGAYFLDRLEKGVWRLEVMPDAIWVQNPFGRNSLKKEVSVVNWRRWPMTIMLPDLGENFAITPLNEGNTFAPAVTGKTFSISPGSYLIVKNGTRTQMNGESRWKNIILKEFAAPSTTLKKTYVLHQPVNEIAVGTSFEVEATVVTLKEPQSVELVVYGGGFRPEVISMKKTKGYAYSAALPVNLIREGFLRYYIVVKEDDHYQTYPSGLEGRPMDWDFYRDEPYEVRVVSHTAPICIFDAITDQDELSRQWSRNSTVLPAEVGKAELLVNPERLSVVDPENAEGGKKPDYSMRYHFGKKIAGRKQDVASAKRITLRGRSLNDRPCIVQVALVSKDGSAYGGTLTVKPGRGDYSLPISDLHKVKLVSLPRPYPTFLPYFFENASSEGLNMSDVETLQISIGPGIPASDLEARHGVAIESVYLE